MKPVLCTVLLSLAMMFVTAEARAHCQVPCGIYDDHARIHAMQKQATSFNVRSATEDELAANDPR